MTRKSLVAKLSHKLHYGFIKGDKPYYWTVQWCRKVEQSGWPKAGWSAALSLLSQLTHICYGDRVAEVRCNTVSTLRLLQPSPTGCQPSLWTIRRLCCLLPTIIPPWPGLCARHRAIILLERACLHNRIGRNWCKFSRPECAASQHDVTRNCSLIG